MDTKVKAKIESIEPEVKVVPEVKKEIEQPKPQSNVVVDEVKQV